MSHSTLTSLDSGIELEPLLEKIQQGAAGVQYLNEEEFRAFLGALRDKLLRLRGKNEDEKYDENFMPLLLKLLSVKDEERRTALFYRDVAKIITKCLVQWHYGYEEDILKFLNIEDNHGKTATDIAQYRPLKRFQQRLEKSHYVLTKKPIVRIFINSTSVEQSNSAYRLADVMKKKLRYDVKITKNFTVETFHEQMNAAAARSSPLIVVILSLAKQDSILDVDGVLIRSRTIVDMMRSTVTKDRLKVLVTECCPRRVLSNPDLKGSGQYSPAAPDKNFFQISSQSSNQPTQPGFVSHLTEAIATSSDGDILKIDDIFPSCVKSERLKQSTLHRHFIFEKSFEDLFAEEDEAPDAFPGYNSEMGNSTSSDAYGTDELVDKITGEDEAPAMLSDYSSEMGSSASLDGSGTEELMNEHVDSDEFLAVNTREDPVRIPMDQKNFRTVQDRLTTFEENVDVDADSNYVTTATEAALAGFVALRYWNAANPSHALKCLACGLIIWNLSYGVALLDVHHKLSGGQCEFLNNLPTTIFDDDMEVDHEKEDENLLRFVTLNTEPDVSSTRNALLKQLGIKPIGDLFSNDKVTDAKLSSIGVTSMETAAPAMAREELRISTFLTFPNEQLMDVSKLVKSGWFWTGIDLEMKCCICGIIHVDWSRSVDPLVRHIQLKADCQFLQANFTSEYLERLKQESAEYNKPQRRIMMEKVKGSQIKPLYDNPITTSVKNNFNKFDLDEYKLKEILYATIEDRKKHGEPDFTSEKELVEHLLKMKEEAANTEDSGATALTEKYRELESLQWKHEGDKHENSSRMEMKRKLPTNSKKPIDLNFKELPSLLLCSICLSNIKNMIFMPCAHITACSGCAMTQSNCPMCRRKIRANASINLLPSVSRYIDSGSSVSSKESKFSLSKLADFPYCIN